MAKKCLFILFTAVTFVICINPISIIRGYSLRTEGSACSKDSSAAEYQTYQGGRYYYNILAGRNYSTQRQAIYNLLVFKAEELHTDFTTNYSDDTYITIDLGDYFQRNAYNNFDLEVYEAADETIAAFFDDNTQYCFLQKGAGTTEYSWEYTIHFYHPQPTEQFPSLDFRLAADRRTMRDMIDASFHEYEELTENAGSRYEIARLVHDKIVSDWDYSSGNIQPFSPGSHDLFGGMGYAADGIVCDAYAKTYDFILNNLGVPSIFVAGDMLAAEGFAAGGHAWNIIEMDNGKKYFADLTFADNHRTNQDVGNYRNPIQYAWFLLGTDTGKFESKHYAGAGSFVGVYERPVNMGGPDYDYRSIHDDYMFLTDFTVDRSMGYDLGTYHMPAGEWDGKPAYYDTDLVYGMDYEVAFEEPLHMGKNRVWFIGKGAYRGMDFGFVNFVEPSVPLGLAITLPFSAYAYTGLEIKPVPVVKNGMQVLQEGRDYLISYQNNIEIGRADILITGLGVYAGTYQTQFQIITVVSGTPITASAFSRIYPEMQNALLVISRNDGSRISENMHGTALPNIQDAANRYGLSVYYMDCYEEDPSAYTFFWDILNEFFRSGYYTSIENYPVLVVFGEKPEFGVYVGEAMTADGGYYPFPFDFPEEIYRVIEEHIYE